MTRGLWWLIGAGIAIRLALAFSTDGAAYDIESLRLVRAALESAPLDAYATLNAPGEGFRWPYPGGFLPLVALAAWASDVTGLEYTSLVRLPAIAADAGIALIVQSFLGARGASERQRVAAVALVMLGPSFIAISGYHGQIDSLAILPAVAALAVWDRAPASRRALYAGALIGVGAAIKTAPLIMLLALLPAVRSWREAGVLVAVAVAIPLAATAPFLLSTPGDVRHALGYKGFPGTGGIAFLIQPEVAEQLARAVPKSSVVSFMHDIGQVLVLLSSLAIAALTAHWRPVDRAAALWLGFYVVTPVFFFQYLVWGLPFLLMAGRLRLVLAIQAVALLPMVLFYRAPWESEGVAYPHWVTMVALWALLLASLILWLRERGPRPRTA